jgi:hypothetical protein
MRAIAPLTTLVLLALLGGCGDTATMIAANTTAAQLPRSKYQPLLVSEADIDAFLATAKAESGKVVRDDLGVYFHEVKATRINSVALQKEDEVALKGLLSSSIGLLEPVYSFEPTGSIKLDWPETERRHAFLTKKVGLRLAPLPASRTYHERIEAAAVDAAAKTKARNANIATVLAGGAELTKDAYAGNYGIYGASFYEGILKPSSSEATYVIKDFMAPQYWNQRHVEHLGGNTAQDQTGNAIAMKGMRNIINNIGLELVPVETYRTMRAGGNYRVASGCRSIDTDTMKAMLKQQAQISAVPYVSAVAAVYQSKTPEAIAAARTELDETMKALPAARREVEAACLAGLRALNVAGVLESKRLR